MINPNAKLPEKAKMHLRRSKIGHLQRCKRCGEAGHTEDQDKRSGGQDRHCKALLQQQQRPRDMDLFKNESNESEDDLTADERL